MVAFRIKISPPGAAHCSPWTCRNCSPARKGLVEKWRRIADPQVGVQAFPAAHQVGNLAVISIDKAFQGVQNRLGYIVDINPRPAGHVGYGHRDLPHERRFPVPNGLSAAVRTVCIHSSLRLGRRRFPDLLRYRRASYGQTQTVSPCISLVVAGVGRSGFPGDSAPCFQQQSHCISPNLSGRRTTGVVSPPQALAQWTTDCR